MDDREEREKMLCEMKGIPYIPKKKKNVVQEVNESVNRDQLFDLKSLFVEKKKEEVAPLVETKTVIKPKRATTLTEETI